MQKLIYSNICSNAQVDSAVEMIAPSIEGWSRELTRGGVLCNGSITYERKTAQFHGCIVAWINLTTTAKGTLVDVTFTGWLAEVDPDDGKFYAIENGFVARRDTIGDVHDALNALARSRRRGK